MKQTVSVSGKEHLAGNTEIHLLKTDHQQLKDCMLTKAVLAQLGISIIDDNLEVDGEIEPGVLLVSQKYNPVLISINAPNETAKKEFVISEIRKMRNDGILVGAVLLAEAWMAPDGNDLPAQHADREEAVVMAVYGCDGKELSIWPIERHGAVSKRGVQKHPASAAWGGWLDEAFSHEGGTA